jgi:hypothetical protein
MGHENRNPNDRRPVVIKLELIVSAGCAACHQAQAVWQRIATENHLTLLVHDIDGPAGKAIRISLGLQTVPAVLINGQLKGIGVQNLAQATEMIAAAQIDAP